MITQLYSINKEETGYQETLVKILSENINDITEIFKDNLSSYLYENRTILSKKKFLLFLEDEVKAILDFLQTMDINICMTRGKKASVNGIGESTVLSMHTHVNSILLKYLQNRDFAITEFAVKIIGVYFSKYTFMFIHDRYEQKNIEKEEIYESLAETAAQQKEEINAKEIKHLKEKYDLIMTLIVNFAHEVKLPLTIILNTMESLKKESKKGYLLSMPVLEDEINDLMSLVTDILDIKNILLGRIIYSHDTIINISSLVAKKINLFKGIMRKNKIRVITEIEKDLFIKLDVKAFDRIFNNIIDNAIKYNTLVDAVIAVSLYEENNSVILKIRDTGKGIPPEQLKNVFEPYYRITGKKFSREGIGAGLPLVKGILEQIAAHISITSKVSKGTTVTIIFKKEVITKDNKDNIVEQVALSRPVNKIMPVLKQEIGGDPLKKTIFFVEDNRELISIMKKAFTPVFNFYFAKDGQEALRLLKVIQKPDIIISDVMMDLMDGYTFYEELKKTAGFKAVPFIFLTAKTTVEERLKGLVQGAVDYIQKPFSVKELKVQVIALLKNAEAIREEEIITIEDKISSILRKKDTALLLFHKRCLEYKLTSREKEVVLCVLKNLTDKEIAHQLCISHATVRTHMDNIREKLDVRSKNQIMEFFNTNPLKLELKIR